MDIPEVGARSAQPTSKFSLRYAAEPGTPGIRLRIDTDRAVASPSLTYGGVAMTCISEGDYPQRVEHHYEILNPPAGVQIITGIFPIDVQFVVRLLDADWFSELRNLT